MPPPSATASSRAIGSPRPVPSASCDTNASKMRCPLRRRHARPRVDDVERHDPVRGREPELDLPAVRRPAERIGEEVRDHLEHAIPVGHDHGRDLGARDRVVDLPATRLLGERPVRLVEHALEIDLLLAHREPVGLELRQVEHVSDEALEPVGLRRDDRPTTSAPDPAR